MTEAGYRKKGVDDVGFYGAQWFVLYDHEDLLLFFQADEVAEPRFFGKLWGRFWRQAGHFLLSGNLQFPAVKAR